MLKNIPNILTVSRIIMIPVLVASFYLNGKVANILASLIFIFASVTDFFDGFLARALKAHTKFGQVLDPIADKLLVAAALVMLIHLQRAPFLPALLILCREILISGLREHLSQFKISIPVSGLAKVKTALQMVAIIILILGLPVLHYPILIDLGRICLWCAAILTLATGYLYMKEGLRHL